MKKMELEVESLQEKIDHMLSALSERENLIAKWKKYFDDDDMITNFLGTIISYLKETDFENNSINVLDLVEVIKKTFPSNDEIIRQRILYHVARGNLDINPVMRSEDDTRKLAEFEKKYIDINQKRIGILMSKSGEKLPYYKYTHGKEDFVREYTCIARAMNLETIDFLDQQNSFDLILSVTDKGNTFYMLHSAIKLNSRTRALQENSVVNRNEIKSLVSRNQKVEKRNRSAEKRILKIESNLFMYMSVFIAVFSLIGINFSYVAGIIENFSMLGVFVLNTSIAVTITLIFLLVDYSKTHDLMLSEDDHVDWKKVFSKKCTGYLVLLAIELAVLVIFIGAAEFIYMK